MKWMGGGAPMGFGGFTSAWTVKSPAKSKYSAQGGGGAEIAVVGC
jgi:hypothetical protein